MEEIGVPTIVQTLKNWLSRLVANMPVQVPHTPRGNVKPHQPMLKGKVCVEARLMRANDTHKRANPHMTSPMKTPMMYSISAPRNGSTPAALKMLVWGITLRATLPSC